MQGKEVVNTASTSRQEGNPVRRPRPMAESVEAAAGTWAAARERTEVVNWQKSLLQGCPGPVDDVNTLQKLVLYYLRSVTSSDPQ